MEDQLINLALVYVFVMNVVGIVLMGLDKRRAIRKEWRVPERTLIIVGILGASIGLFAGLRLFRHKTKKPLFYIGLPVIAIIQITVIVRYVL